jgi:hypothetical protein
MVPLLAKSQNLGKKGKKKHWLRVGFVVARKTQGRRRRRLRRRRRCGQLLRLEEGSGEVGRLGFWFP